MIKICGYHFPDEDSKDAMFRAIIGTLADTSESIISIKERIASGEADDNDLLTLKVRQSIEFKLIRELAIFKGLIPEDVLFE